jgi:hypothetical protein
VPVAILLLPTKNNEKRGNPQLAGSREKFQKAIVAEVNYAKSNNVLESANHAILPDRQTIHWISDPSGECRISLSLIQTRRNSTQIT